jgi:hypothetical protein
MNTAINMIDNTIQYFYDAKCAMMYDDPQFKPTITSDIIGAVSAVVSVLFIAAAARKINQVV